MQQNIFAGQNSIQAYNTESRGEYVQILGEENYCIRNYDCMPPFFMSIVSSSDHWLFISSTTGLTAGRMNADSALFPYDTDDKITESHRDTGSLTIIKLSRAGKTYLWKPFSTRYSGIYHLERNIYKNISGNKLIFEEINHDLACRFRTTWRTTEKFGFVKTSALKSLSETALDEIELLDGLQNILPYGANAVMQTTFSNLLNAYKRNELEPGSGLAMFTLSSTLTDLAEPSESLKATTVWQVGLDNAQVLLSTLQVENFLTGNDISQETDICGLRGAYLVQSSFTLQPAGEKEWHFIADLNQDGSQVAALLQQLKQHHPELIANLQQDIEKSSLDLLKIIASADGLQHTAKRLNTAHHFANVMFNSMRGGVFAGNDCVDKSDLLDFITTRNKTLPEKFHPFFENLPEKCTLAELIQHAAHSSSADLQRLCHEYMPLTFSRRHGDPSRPWNKFSINIKKPDGSQKLDYQGNWRDIFQNWEPLAYSYPEYIESMLCIFLNATTADGYNPYRITRSGIEWEIPEPNNPWANIGYWGDHQIIYLQKILEVSHRFHQGRLETLLTENIFSHANVPYRIKPYDALLEDPYATINFDWTVETLAEERVKSRGTDGKLVFNSSADPQVMHVNMLEKLLILLLAKLSNFVPDGGIWMNTQRPEWNDANNALVGKGLSLVTLGHLRRFIVFLNQILTQTPDLNFAFTHEVARFYQSSLATLENFAATMRAASSFSPHDRRLFMDAIGQAGSAYRTEYYRHGFSGDFTSIEKQSLLTFLNLAQEFVEHSLRKNLAGSLYHSYNILSLNAGIAQIGHLSEMLEGQVSILSSGLLSTSESLLLLQNLKKSRLYRPDQHSYILYPHRDLPGFLHKNNLHQTQVKDLALVSLLVKNNDNSLISRDVNGTYHFNGSFRNAKDLSKALLELRQRSAYQALVDAESASILQLFEQIFNHQAFTGRSGTFYAYEGLGSIYWHMVAKLLLAVQETCMRAARENDSQETTRALLEIYYDIRAGLGYNKTPQAYGAFPTDPYSHTPAGQGAKQPGMTGQVKEEILTRLVEMGLQIHNSKITFNSLFVAQDELISAPEYFNYINVTGQFQNLELPSNSLAFTFCQVPVVIQRSSNRVSTLINLSDGSQQVILTSELDEALSQHIFSRDNYVRQLTFYMKEN